MTKTGPATELAALKRSISEIEHRFLSAHLKSAPSLKPPSRRERLDIAAYVVLSHGALENSFAGCCFVGADAFCRSLDEAKESNACNCINPAISTAACRTQRPAGSLRYSSNSSRCSED